MLRYLKGWIAQLRWQRLEPFEKLAQMLLDHLDGILNYCRVKVKFGVVEAINGNIKMLIRRGRGYRNLGYLLLKAQRMAAARLNSLHSGKLHEIGYLSNSCAEPKIRTRGRY
jgi:Transposase